ncbi:MAG TPA: hypothetical protein PLQ78_04635 [Flavipsychrobacter sp.]|nr:hypothetical protein [Flavipsychrobacter sp.]
MRKIILTSMAAIAVLSSCNKTNNVLNPITNNQFKIGANTFTAINVQGAGGVLVAAGSNGTNTGSISCYFNGNVLPTANGTYKITGNPDAPGEVYITAATNIGGVSKSYGTKDNASNPSATITVSGGKVTIEIPDVEAKESNGTAITISGKLKQN